jgi:TonB-dependent starch-binding outer membrane protein SusC
MNEKLLRNSFFRYQTLKASSEKNDSCIRKVSRFTISLILVIVVTGFGYSVSFAQDSFQVTGVVTDAQDGSPLPGVNVIVQGSQEATGSTIGTTTTIDGTYSINVPNDLNVLVFTYVGYVTNTVNIEGRTEINVQLQQDIQLLEDIVVVGYGTQRQRDATGSVVAITERDFNQGVISSPEQLLQGRMAGVQITTASPEQEQIYVFGELLLYGVETSR